MPNTFKHATDWITMEALRLLKNRHVLGQFFNTDFEENFEGDYVKGDTIFVKMPFKGTTRKNTMAYSPQAITRISTPIVVDQVLGFDFEWDDIEAALKVERGREQFRKQYMDKGMAQIGQDLDSALAQYAYQQTNNVVGALGTDPTSMTTFGQARQTAVELACPPSGKMGVIIPPRVNTSMVDAMKGLFIREQSEQYKEGYIGRFQGADWYESMSLYQHTAGTWAGAVTVTSAPANGATTLSLTCTNGDTFKKGDKFSIANVLPLNPMTRRTFGATTKRWSIVSADQTISGTSATITVSPAIYWEGPYQNCNSQPAAAAALTLWPGTGTPNGKQGTVGLQLHSDAFALVGVKLQVPKSVEIASQTQDPNTGLAVRFIRAFDPVQSKMINRFDVLFGFGNLYPDSCAVAIPSA